MNDVGIGSMALITSRITGSKPGDTRVEHLVKLVVGEKFMDGFEPYFLMLTSDSTGTILENELADFLFGKSQQPIWLKGLKVRLL